jgi:hypothetical protein
MAVWTIKAHNELSRFFVLAPERYDPRREAKGQDVSSILIGQVATVVRQTLTPAAAKDGSYLVLDTSHAREGVIISPEKVIGASGIGSAKKAPKSNDVIISRLRPYLRQVAFVDEEIQGWSEGVTLLCSTEFFVLRSNNKASIAFLVPFLLSPFVQQILSASQEGGHHPRFDENALSTLPIPGSILDRRDEFSRSVEKSIRSYRASEKLMASLVAEVSSLTDAMQG